MNILCLDYGTKRIGVAIATSPIAQPLGVITNTKNPRLTDVVTDQALDQILKLINEFSVELILVGISEGAMAQKTREFIEKLKIKTPCVIEEIDETLTSAQATKDMMHMKRKKRTGERDHFAATVMLQDYLDLNNLS